MNVRETELLATIETGSSVAADQSILVLVDQLTAERQSLAERLQAAAAPLLHDGIPLANTLLAELGQFRARAEALLQQATAAAETSADGAAAPVATGNDQTASIEAAPGAIATEPIRLSDIRETVLQRLRLNKSRLLLGKVATLQHKDDAEFEPLRAAQADAQRLLTRVAAAPAFDLELDALAQDRHALAALLKLIEHGSTLADDVWVALSELVADTYGRPLATALARGRIVSRDFASSSPPLSGGIVSASTAATAPLPASPAANALTQDVPVYVDVPTEAPAIAPPAAASPESVGFAGDFVLDEIGRVESRRSARIDQLFALHKTDLERELGRLSGLPPKSELPLPHRDSISASAVDHRSSGDVPAAPTPAVTPENTPSGGAIQPSRRDEPTASQTEPAINPELVYEFTTRPKSFAAEPAVRTDALTLTDMISAVNPATADPAVADTLAHVAVLDAVLENDSGIIRALASLREARLSAEAHTRPVHPTTIARLAHLAVTETGERRQRALQDLQFQLLLEDQLVPAYHLARCCAESGRNEREFAPAWLIRALALGRHQTYPKGELARQLEEDLRQFRMFVPRWTGEDSTVVAEKLVAVGFLLRAAALIPALLSGSSAAGHILRSFKIESGFSQLYNYCSRLASYGDRLQGRVSDLFRADCGVEAWDREHELLQQAAQNWLPATIRQHVPYTRSAPLFVHANWSLTASTSQRHEAATLLWAKWQETMLLASRLLQPVIAGDLSERNSVQQEIIRLNAQVRVDKVEVTGTRPGNNRGIVLPLESMKAVIQEATDLASRWVRLCDSQPAPTSPPVSAPLEELRAEVLERTDGVLNELRAYLERHPQRWIGAGVACLTRAVEHVRTLCLGQLQLPFREPDVRHLLHAELLKIPLLQMDAEWSPSIDSATLERELLDHLAHGVRDWQAAFQLQCAQGDHVATGRLLDLNVWQNEAEREELNELRQRQIQDNRAALLRELDDIQTLLSEAQAANKLAEQEAPAYARRLERLRTALPRMLDFGIGQLQLSQLRLAIQRRMGILPPSRLTGVDTGTGEHHAARNAAELAVEKDESLNPGITALLGHTQWVMDIFPES